MTSDSILGQRQITANRGRNRKPAAVSGDRLRWRRHAHLRIGQSEMWPVGSHVKLLAHARAISPKAAHSVIEAFDQIRAMTWRLLNPKP